MLTASVSFKPEIIKRLDAIVKNPKSIFSTRSQLITHCILMSLPEIEKELEQ